MGIAILKIKILPESPNTNLEDIRKNVEQNLKNLGVVKANFEIEDIAFGLKALIVTTALSEEIETEKAEEACKVNGVSSCEIIDHRRAFG